MNHWTLVIMFEWKLGMAVACGDTLAEDVKRIGCRRIKKRLSSPGSAGAAGHDAVPLCAQRPRADCTVVFQLLRRRGDPRCRPSGQTLHVPRCAFRGAVPGTPWIAGNDNLAA